MRRTLTTALVLLAALAFPASALAAGGPVLVTGGLFGDIFGGIAHAVLGAFTWTISLASSFLLTTFGAIVHLLIPHSWITKGLQIAQWIVAVPNYAATISSPGGGQVYGFAGVNALRDLFMWLGLATAPLTLTYATSRAMLGQHEPVALPTLRLLTVAALVVFYPYWWGQATALADQVTNAILSVPAIGQGLYKLMAYAVGGVALGGWQLIDLGLMAAIAVALLGLILCKVALILLGAVLYATGPLMIGLVATSTGHQLARAWLTAVATLFTLGVVWATLLAVGALLINDAGTGGPLIAGHSGFGSLLGGLLLAVAGLTALWLCLKAAREAGAILRLQLAGLLVTSRSTNTASAHAGAAPSAGRTSGQSLRAYGSRIAAAGGAAAGELAATGPAGAAVVTGARAVGAVGRRGLIGTAALAAREAATHAARRAEAPLGGSRAGVIAARMARAGTASWQQTGTTAHTTAARAGTAQPAPTMPIPRQNPTSAGSAGPGRGRDQAVKERGAKPVPAPSQSRSAPAAATASKTAVTGGQEAARGSGPRTTAKRADAQPAAKPARANKPSSATPSSDAPATGHPRVAAGGNAAPTPAPAPARPARPATAAGAGTTNPTPASAARPTPAASSTSGVSPSGLPHLPAQVHGLSGPEPPTHRRAPRISWRARQNLAPPATLPPQKPVRAPRWRVRSRKGGGR